jgi:hypothetical protein
MFTFDKYKITFEHMDYGHPLSLPGTNAEFTHVTYCYIDVLVDEDYALLSTGQALCSASDIFEKAIGRKVSLTRALKNAGFDRETRTAIWKEYWSLVKKPR